MKVHTKAPPTELRHSEVVSGGPNVYDEAMRKPLQTISIYLGSGLAGMIGGGIGGFALGDPSTVLFGMLGGGVAGLIAARFFRPGRDS